MEEQEYSEEEIFYDCCEDTISDEKQISNSKNNKSSLETITQTEITETTSKEQREQDQQEIITSWTGAVPQHSEAEPLEKGNDSADTPRSLTQTEDPETATSDCPDDSIVQNSRHEAVPGSEPAISEQKQIPVLDVVSETEDCLIGPKGVTQTGNAVPNGSDLHGTSYIQNLEYNGDPSVSEPVNGDRKSHTLNSHQACSHLHGVGEPIEAQRDNPLEGVPTTPTELETLAGDVGTATKVEEYATNPALSEPSIAAETMNNQPKVVGESQGDCNEQAQTENQQSKVIEEVTGQTQYEDQILAEKPKVIEEGRGQDQGQQPKVIEENRGQADKDQTLIEQPKDMQEAQGHSPDQACEEENDESSDDESALTETEIEERRIEAKYLKEEGNEVYRNGDFVEAERLYTEALKICPKSLKKDRAVMYSNRSACLVKLDKTEPAIEDCTRAVKLYPTYLKAFLRRAQLYEKLEKYEEAMEDCNKVLELDPSIHTARATLLRLPEEIEKRNEKLKTQMMSSLKDIGNLFLRPFGLSTDSFQMQQDPNSGSYNIQFNNAQNGQNNGPDNGR